MYLLYLCFLFCLTEWSKHGSKLGEFVRRLFGKRQMISKQYLRPEGSYCHTLNPSVLMSDMIKYESGYDNVDDWLCWDFYSRLPCLQYGMTCDLIGNVLLDICISNVILITSFIYTCIRPFRLTENWTSSISLLVVLSFWAFSFK